MACPNCGQPGRKPLLLTVHFATPDHPLRHSRVLCCDGCDCRFYENQTPPDYTEGEMLGRGRVAFYLQQGAGVSLITRPLARVTRPPGSIYLEVGCGFGFGLDFAIRAKGWQGSGIDPGQIAGLGAALLGVPVALRYLGAAEPEWQGNCDVVMASETIEHVPSPAAFIATLRRALRPGGVLVLTTPSGERLHPDQSRGVLVPLLSPGLHLVFQTQVSLRRLLDEAGFSDIVLETDGTSLVAYASDAPLLLEHDRAVLRETYRDYLEHRAATVPVGSDLWLAFAGRNLQEAVNDEDMPRAERAFTGLRAGCVERFGFDLETLHVLPAEAEACSLERLAELLPLNLGGILLADGVRRLAAGAARSTLGRRFDLAANAADAMRRALGELAMEDGMSEAIGWAARAEAVLCDAAAGQLDVPMQLIRLPAPPGDASTAAPRRRAIVEQALVCAVNERHFALGREIAAVPGAPTLADADLEPLTATRRDALFSLAVLDVQPGPAANPRGAARRFAAVLKGEGDLAWHAARGLFQALDLAWDDADAALLLRYLRHRAAMAHPPADLPNFIRVLAHRLFVSLVNAGAYAAAAEFADLVDAAVAEEGAAPLSAPGRDAAFCLGILALQPGGDAARARDLLARVRFELQPAEETGLASAMFWSALRGELQVIARTEGEPAAEHHRRQVLARVMLDQAPPDFQPRAGPADALPHRDALP